MVAEAVPTSTIIGTAIIIVSIILCIIAMSVDSTRDMYPFLLTLIIGLAMALIMCFVRISEMMSAKDMEFGRKPIIIKSCPEYWSRVDTPDNTLKCKNSFITSHPTPKKVYVYTPNTASDDITVSADLGDYSIHNLNQANKNSTKCIQARDTGYAWIEPYQKCRAYAEIPRLASTPT
jgi:hypothetical protein